MIDFKRLRYFMAVAEAGGFREAADRLGMTQPPLSHQIMELEKQIGERLFMRLPRSVELTEAGRALQVEAMPILAMASGLVERVREIAGAQEGHLRVGVTTAAAADPLLVSILKAYRSDSPEIVLRLYQDESTKLCEAVAEKHVDLAFVRSQAVAGHRLVSKVLVAEPMLLAVPRDHRLSAMAEVAMGDLEDEAFVLFERSHATALYDAVVAACEGAGFAARITHHAPQKMSALTLVAGGAGVTFVPASLKGVLSDHVAMKPIRSGGPSATLVMVSRGAESATTRRMCALARRIVAERPSPADQALVSLRNEGSGLQR